MFFLFGTPIGNRTLVSAVRGRRLEPLDHEGKSILLCDNIIILHLMQANADMFSQKKCCVRFIRFLQRFINPRRKTKLSPTNLLLPPTYTKNSFFIFFAPYNTICIFIAICFE